MRPWNVVVTLASLILLATAACKKEPGTDASSPEAPPPPPPVIREVRIGLTADISAVPLVLAEAQERFKAQGVTATLEVHDSASDVAEGILSGKLDAGMLDPAEALRVRRKGSFAVTCVLARNASSITVSQALWDAIQPDLLRAADGQIVHPIHADPLGLICQEAHTVGEPVYFQIRSPLATHALTLRYWLGAAGIASGPSLGSRPHAFVKRASLAIAGHRHRGRPQSSHARARRLPLGSAR